MPSDPVSPIDKWKAEAEALPPAQVRINVPFHVLLGEAVDVARFYDKYRKANDGAGQPGLESVADKKRHLTAATGKDILSLLEATQQAQTAYRLTLSPELRAPLERSAFVLGEMTAALEWLFDDGMEDERDVQLDAVKKAYEDTPDSHDALAAELADYAGLADAYRDELGGLGGFDAALIDEAKQLAATLRERPAVPAAPSAATADAKALRDRLAALLAQRMGIVRAAARFVFRNDAEIIREATSAYERRRKAAARRAAAKNQNPGGGAPG